MSTIETPAETRDDGNATIAGPPAAGLIAAGIGALTLGVLVTLAEASTGIKDFLQFTDRVGPLGGKTIFATIAYFVSFLALGLAWKDRSFALRSIVIATIALLGLGLLGTFPPFFQAFAPE